MDFAALLAQARAEAAAARAGAGGAGAGASAAAARAGLAGAAAARAAGAALRELVPAAVWYASDFVDAAEARALEDDLRARPWRQLSGRRLQNWGGVPHPSGTILETMPPLVDALAERLHLSGVFADEKPNQALVNLYNADEGIAPHQDGPTFKPRAAILSLGEKPAVLAFRDPSAVRADGADDELAGTVARIVMEPRSLVVFSGPAYLEWEHWVPATRELSVQGAANASMLKDQDAEAPTVVSKSERISLTMRCVAKVTSRADEADLALDPELRHEVARRHEWWRRAISQ